MYNRYTPQSDGSYRRDRMPDLAARPPVNPPTPPPPLPPPIPAPPCAPIQEKGGIGAFLRQLLPQNFDTGDLLIILLLLLMAGDSEEEKGNALLTLAFYLFM